MEDKKSVVTSSDLQYILDVNQKAISIYIEVAKQYEKITSTLEELEDWYKKLQKDISVLKENKNENIENIISIENELKSCAEKIKILQELSVNLTKLLQDNSIQLRDDIKQIKEKQDLIYKKIEKPNFEEIEHTLKDIDKRMLVFFGSGLVGAIVTIATMLITRGK